MKELSGFALNVGLTDVGDGETLGTGELVLVVSEPEYTIDAGGELVRQRVCSQIRLSVTAKSLRRAIESLGKYAAAIEEFEGRFAGKQTPIPGQNA